MTPCGANCNSETLLFVAVTSFANLSLISDIENQHKSDSIDMKYIDDDRIYK
jgi:hypothetical protein